MSIGIAFVNMIIIFIKLSSTAGYHVEGGAKIFGVFRVKNHDFTQKNHIFPIAEGGAKIVEDGILTPLSTIFQIYGGGHFHWWRKLEYPEEMPTCRNLSHNVVSSTPHSPKIFKFRAIYRK
jgi:hypothetical protein